MKGPSPSKRADGLSTHSPAKQLQQAMEILPNHKAHWESTIEELNTVSKFNRPAILLAQKLIKTLGEKFGNV